MPTREYAAPIVVDVDGVDGSRKALGGGMASTKAHVRLTILGRTRRQGKGGPQTLRTPRGMRSGACSTPVPSPSRGTPAAAIKNILLLWVAEKGKKQHSHASISLQHGSNVVVRLRFCICTRRSPLVEAIYEYAPCQNGQILFGYLATWRHRERHGTSRGASR